MDNYPLQRALFERIRGSGSHTGAGAPVLPLDQETALAQGDLRALAEYGVHPVLLNAFARLIGKSRDEYRELLVGTGVAVEEVTPRWRAS